MISRRVFLRSAAAAGVGAACGAPVLAQPLGLPLGLQLYSVRDLLPNDYQGTLRQIAALGYREVEAAGFYGHNATEVKQAMQTAGLRCVSAHYPFAQLDKLDQVIRFGEELGLQFIVCSSPGFKDADRVKGLNYQAAMQKVNLDDWRWNADQFNRMGERVTAAGMQFAYHNHTFEFRPEAGVLPFDELLRLTESAKVSFEMDCGWVVVGGQSPVKYLDHYAKRFSMLHVKDFKMSKTTAGTTPPSAELGEGSIDYRPILAAARRAQIKHIFVEQEEFDMPPLEALKKDADYMRSLGA